jgi:hypothetical protein
VAVFDRLLIVLQWHVNSLSGFDVWGLDIFWGLGYAVLRERPVTVWALGWIRGAAVREPWTRIAPCDYQDHTI